MWRITEDTIADEGSTAVGTTSRSYIADVFDRDQLFEFRLRDDDGEVYYTGYSNIPDSFGPLVDFGRGMAGCTEIQYRNHKGEWETL